MNRLIELPNFTMGFLKINDVKPCGGFIARVFIDRTFIALFIVILLPIIENM